MAIREGRWDCPGCGSTAIQGRHLDCPGCGRPRPAGVRFYLTDDAAVVTDPERLAEARAGADWVCRQCDASNRAALAHCGGCGAERGTSPTQPVVRHAAGNVPRPPAKPAAAPRRLAAVRAPAWTGRMRMRDHAGIALLAACVLLFAGWKVAGRISRGAVLPAVVVGKGWSHTYVVQERRLRDSAGWKMPDSALAVSREQRLVRHDTAVVGYERFVRREPRVDSVRTGSRRVRREVEERERTGSETYVCGQRDMGNGYFEDETCERPVYGTVTRTRTVTEPVYRIDTVMVDVEDERPVLRITPVYAAWHTFRVPEWVPVDTIRMSGLGDTPPAAPAQPGPGRRLVPGFHDHNVQVRDSRGGVHQSWVDRGRFGMFRVGQPVAYRTSAGGGEPPGLTSADELPACRRWHRGRGRRPPESLGCSPRPRR